MVGAMEPLRIVAVGDSLSEGVGDPAPGWAGVRGELHGWVHDLSGLLEATGVPNTVTNFALRGAVVADVESHQLGRAVALRPDVAVCFIGVNNVIRPGFDAEAFGTTYDRVIRALTAASSTVVTTTVRDVARTLPLPAGARRRVRANAEAANRAIRATVEATGVLLLEADGPDDPIHAGMVSADRLHPNSLGHRFIAHRVATLLRTAGAVPAATPLPNLDTRPASLRSRVVEDARHLAWLGAHGLTPLWRQKADGGM